MDSHQQIINELKNEIEILERKVSYLSHFKSTSMEKLKKIQQDTNTLNKTIQRVQQENLTLKQKIKDLLHYARVW